MTPVEVVMKLDAADGGVKVLDDRLRSTRFISDVSTTSTNIGIASRRLSRWLLCGSSGTLVLAASLIGQSRQRRGGRRRPRSTWLARIQEPGFQRRRQGSPAWALRGPTQAR